MYNIEEMRSELEDAISIAENSVRKKFIEAFEDIYKDSIVPSAFPSGKHSIAKYVINSASDLKGVISGAGFYIIFTSYEMPENTCSLSSGNMNAIYRGECATVKKRVLSHIFNKKYKSEYEQRKTKYLEKLENSGKDFYEQFWPACLKLDPFVSGINIDEPPYADHSWMVIVHGMKGSIQEVREQAEFAFDCAFTKPEASREKSNM